jgi:hypothetical protein
VKETVEPMENFFEIPIVSPFSKTHLQQLLTAVAINFVRILKESHEILSVAENWQHVVLY